MIATVVVVLSTIEQKSHVLGQFASMKSPNSDPGSQYPWLRHPPHRDDSRLESWQAGSGTNGFVVVLVLEVVLGAVVAPLASHSQNMQPSGSFQWDGLVPVGHSSWVGQSEGGQLNGDPWPSSSPSWLEPCSSSPEHSPQLAGQTAEITPRLHKPVNCAHSPASAPGRHSGGGPTVVVVVVVLVVVMAFPSQSMLHATGHNDSINPIAQLPIGISSHPAASTRRHSSFSGASVEGATVVAVGAAPVVIPLSEVVETV